jgi:hypothetical protein
MMPPHPLVAPSGALVGKECPSFSIPDSASSPLGLLAVALGGSPNAVGRQAVVEHPAVALPDQALPDARPLPGPPQVPGTLGEKPPLDDRRVGVPCALWQIGERRGSASGYAPRYSVAGGLDETTDWYVA